MANCPTPHINAYPEDFADLNTVQLGDRIHAQMFEALQEIRK